MRLSDIYDETGRYRGTVWREDPETGTMNAAGLDDLRAGQVFPDAGSAIDWVLAQPPILCELPELIDY